MPRLERKSIGNQLVLPTPSVVHPPEGAIIVSYSELDTFRQCPLKHQLSYRQRWTRPVKEGGALDKGTRLHLVLEEHFKFIRDFQQAALEQLGGEPTVSNICKVLDAQRKQEAALLQHILAELEAQGHFWDTDGSGAQSDTQELVQWMYQGYVEANGTDANWWVLDVEGKQIYPLPDPTDSGGPTFYLKVKLDVLVWDRNTKRVQVVDHKSAADLKAQKEIDLDDQFPFYTAVMRGFGVDVQGSIYDGIRSKKLVRPMSLSERYYRYPNFKTDIELRNILVDGYNTAFNAYNIQRINSSPNPQQCGWKCDFRENHIQMRKGTPLEVTMRDYGFVQDFTRH